MTLHNKALTIFFIIIFGVTSAGCSPNSPVDLVTQLPLISTSSINVSETSTVTPTLERSAAPPTARESVILTPESVFSSSTLVPLSDQNPSDLCKQVPMPELRRADNDKPLIGGRFVLCVLREGISAMDLDNGTLISSDDPDADILLGASQSTLDGTISYYAAAINNAKIDEIESSSITYELCKDIVLSLSRPGIFIVDEGALACVLTTQKQIVLVRAESVDTFGGETVEFSFAILRE